MLDITAFNLKIVNNMLQLKLFILHKMYHMYHMNLGSV